MKGVIYGRRKCNTGQWIARRFFGRFPHQSGWGWDYRPAMKKEELGKHPSSSFLYFFISWLIIY